MIDGSDYVALHVHTEHSELDGLARVDELVAAAVADGHVGVAATDHGSLAVHWKLYEAARAAGITPILGLEAYFAIGSRHDKEIRTIASGDDFDGSGGMGDKRQQRYEHLTLLAKNATGWRNLVTGHNASWGHFFYKPRWDMDLLARHADGLIVGTGCLGGPVAGALLRGDVDAANAAVVSLVEVCGRENVFVEVMDHGLALEQAVIPGLVEIAGRFGLRVVATNDSHYVRAEQAAAHDAWLAMGQSKGGKTVLVTDPNRFAFNGGGYHFRTAAEMHALFDHQPGTHDAVRNSRAVAEMVEPDVIPVKGHRLPVYPTPDGVTAAELLYEKTRQGAVGRWGENLPIEIKAELRHELDVIGGAGFDDYALIVSDIIDESVRRGIRKGPGRGSAAGSRVMYALGVTDIEPRINDLLFSRFLDPGRPDMPDVDMDFDAERRDELIQYAADKYGRDRTARVGSIGTSWARSAIKDVARVTGWTASAAEKIAKAVPDFAGKEHPLRTILAVDNPAGAPLRALMSSDPSVAHLVMMAMAVEGVASRSGIHACGVIIGDESLTSLIPMRRDPSDPDALPITEWDGEALAAFGLVKFDFLAIKDLTGIERCVQMIAETTGVKVYPETATMDPADPRAKAAFDLISAGRTAGVFQLSSPGMTELARAIRPHRHEDLTALGALYRPGPMGAGMHHEYAARARGKAIDYALFTRVPAEQEVIAEVLAPSLGVLAYQEQMQRLSVLVADFDDSQSNKLRKGIAKKKTDILDAMYPLWIDGGVKGARRDGVAKVSFQRETLDRLWETFRASGEYAFNKSHSAAYGRISFETAWLKANWPAQFGAALLASTESGKAKAGKRQALIGALRGDGIVVRAPGINSASVKTSVLPDGSVQIGLSEIAAVGEPAAWIVAERDRGGPFASLADLVSRVVVAGDDGKRTSLSSTIVTALAESGALDEFGSRMGHAMLACVNPIPDDLPVPDAEWGIVERAARQRARLGVIIDGDPVVLLADQLSTWLSPAGTPPIPIGSIPTTSGVPVHALGVVAAVEEKSYARGVLCEVTVADPTGYLEATFWNESWTSMVADGTAPKPGEIAGISGITKAPWRPPTDDDDAVVEEDLPPSLRGYSVWRQPIYDPVRRPSVVLTPGRAPEPTEPQREVEPVSIEPQLEVEPTTAPDDDAPQPDSEPDPEPVIPEPLPEPESHDVFVVGIDPQKRLRHQVGGAWSALVRLYPGLRDLDADISPRGADWHSPVLARCDGGAGLVLKAATAYDRSVVRMIVSSAA